MRRVLDWHAAVLSGLISGIIFILLNLLIIPGFLEQDIWIMIRDIASIFLGEEHLTNPPVFDPKVFILVVIIHFSFSALFAFLIAYIIYRWGLLVGIIGGAFLGLGVYGIDLYVLSYFSPWFEFIKSWPLMVSHIIFGASAGGIYELFEIERFVAAEN
jgi:hypothetical protein